MSDLEGDDMVKDKQAKRDQTRAHAKQHAQICCGMRRNTRQYTKPKVLVLLQLLYKVLRDCTELPERYTPFKSASSRVSQRE